mmetsp:Transcript_74245/g.227125  ORF Transcript_74245/g.227125 Transcript_74245/m.227125 type:complete len:296 (+) Transcript_74245:219-1106(+)
MSASVADLVARQIVFGQCRRVGEKVPQSLDHLLRVAELVVVQIDVVERLRPPGAAEDIDDAGVAQVVASQLEHLQGVPVEHQDVGDVLAPILPDVAVLHGQVPERRVLREAMGKLLHPSSAELIVVQRQGIDHLVPVRAEGPGQELAAERRYGVVHEIQILDGWQWIHVQVVTDAPHGVVSSVAAPEANGLDVEVLDLIEGVEHHSKGHGVELRVEGPGLRVTDLVHPLDDLGNSWNFGRLELLLLFLEQLLELVEQVRLAIVCGLLFGGHGAGGRAPMAGAGRAWRGRPAWRSA